MNEKEGPLKSDERDTDDLDRLVDEYFEQIDQDDRLTASEFISNHPEAGALRKRIEHETRLRSILAEIYRLKDVDDNEGVIDLIEANIDIAAEIVKCLFEDEFVENVFLSDQQPLPETESHQETDYQGHAINTSRFKVEKPLDGGGMGLVHVAFDNVLERRVVLKEIKPDLDLDPTIISRFDLEATLYAKLGDHPNIVQLFDRVMHQSRDCLVLQYVEGFDLQEFLQNQKDPLPFGKVAELVRDIAKAVQHAHARQVIHRDIKPANVLLEIGTGRPKLTDFGLGKRLLKGDASATTTVGHAGQNKSNELENADFGDNANELDFDVGLAGKLT